MILMEVRFMDNCIFCKIAHHEIGGKVLYEDDVCMAFLDLSQATNGLSLIHISLIIGIIIS